MNVTFLSLRDYFNYFFAGVAWLLLVALIVSGFVTLNDIKLVQDALGAVLVAALAVFAPYVVGFSLSQLGVLATRNMVRLVGDPQWLAIDPNDLEHQGRWYWATRDRKQLVVGPTDTTKPWRNRLLNFQWIGADTIGLVARNMNTALGLKAGSTSTAAQPARKVGEVGMLESNAMKVLGTVISFLRLADHRLGDRLWDREPLREHERSAVKSRFNLIRTAVRNSGLATAELANRNRLLANLAESLLIPVPAILTVLAIRIILGVTRLGFGWDVAVLLVLITALLAVIAVAGSVMMLAHQYLYLREYEVKHVCFTFATLTAAGEKPRQSDKGDSQSDS